MRIRRKPWARPELENCSFFISNPAECLGQWQNKFLNKQSIFLELGCGKGKFISKIAANNPDINFIAVDIKSEMLALAKRNIEREFFEKDKKICNILLTAHDITRISLIFNENDLVDRIYINFCNPWPRKKHNKRRLTHSRQLVQYRTFLKASGEIYFKTDDDELFYDTISYLSNSGFKIKYRTNDLHNSDFPENIMTEHEKMFSEQGINIKFLIAEKL